MRFYYNLSEKIKKERRSLSLTIYSKKYKRSKTFVEENVHSIRPGYGLPPKYLKEILDKRAT